MFGLGGKKKEEEAAQFELEVDLKDSKKKRAIKDTVVDRMQKIKNKLRAGCDKEEFDRFGVLLHGYASLLKVIARFK